MQIEIYSDVVCPWCFIGKRRLEQALETSGYARQTHIAWRPFQLNPTMPKEGMDRRVYLDAKFGGTEARRAIEERVAKAGEAVGIVFAFDRIERTPNTFEGIRRPLDPIEGKNNPDRLTSLSHAFLNRPPGLCAAELRVKIDATVHAFLRHRRIQLKRTPRNVRLSRVAGSLERLF